MQFLRIAQGSLKEVETHLMLAVRVELADPTATDSLLSLCDEEGKMLAALIRSVNNQVREDVAKYSASG